MKYNRCSLKEENSAPLMFTFLNNLIRLLKFPTKYRVSRTEFLKIVFSHALNDSAALNDFKKNSGNAKSVKFFSNSFFFQLNVSQQRVIAENDSKSVFSCRIRPNKI